jgi:tetrathionate reductase subunit B
MHCDKPTCVEACPTAATYRDEKDGIVKVNPRLCIGCGSCVPACPYGARYRHPETHIVDKCDFCAGRLSIGKEPACVETCPTRARVFGDISDVSSTVYSLLKGKEITRVVNWKTNTDPAIYYLGKTSPVDWPVEAEPPGAIRMFRDVFNPLLKGVVCLSGLGVLVMWGKQLFSDEPHHPAPSDEDTGKGVDDGSHNDQAP